jgi:hypothetical protein
VQVVVKVAGQERELPSGTPSEQAGELARAAGTTLAPQHPGTRDPELASWYVAEVADPAGAERLAVALRGTPGVEAAYVKPGDEPASPSAPPAP